MRQGRDEVRVPPEPVEHVERGASEIGQFADAAADLVEHAREAVAEVPLSANPADDVTARATAYDLGIQGPEEAIDPRVLGGNGRLVGVGRGEPLGERVEMGLGGIE